MTPKPHITPPLELLGLLLIVAALTAAWVTPWVRWLWQLAQPPLPLPWHFPVALAGLVVGGAALTQALLRRADRPLRPARLVVGVAGTAAVLAFVWLSAHPYLSPDLFRRGPDLLRLAAPAGPPLVVGVFGWWRGLQLGRGAIGYHTISGVFWGGVVGLAGLLIANSLFPALPAAALLPSILVYFGLGLAGLAVTSLRRLRMEQRSVTLTALRLNRFWLLTAALCIAAVLAGGLLTARLIAPEALDSVNAALNRVAATAAYGLGLVIAPLALLADRLLQPLYPFLTDFMADLIEGFRRLVGLARGLFGFFLRLMAVRLPRLFTVEGLEAFIHSPAVQAGSRWGLVALLALAVGLLYAFVLRRFTAWPVTSEDEQRDSVFSRHLLWAQLRRLLRARRPRVTAAAPYLALSGAPDDARLIVRRCYQAMLEWALTLSLPRLAGQTPRAYGETLAGALPEGQEAIAILTHTYVLARYAAEAPSLEQARHAERAWDHLRALRPPATPHSPRGPRRPIA